MYNFSQDVTDDTFLAGRVRAFQPKSGFRAGVDTVVLAAAVTAEPGQRILELGCGPGIASLCLASRVPQLTIHGLEPQKSSIELARANAERAEVDLTLLEGSVDSEPSRLRALSFDHVFANPPFFKKSAGGASVDAERNLALRTEVPFSDWVDCALRRLKERGILTLVQHIERLPELLIALEGRAGEICVKPILGREGASAKRFLLRARKTSSTPFSLAAPLIMHAGAEHLSDAPDYSAEALAVLRDGEAVHF